jgi:hypothetical protein
VVDGRDGAVVGVVDGLGTTDITIHMDITRTTITKPSYARQKPVVLKSF